MTLSLPSVQARSSALVRCKQLFLDDDQEYPNCRKVRWLILPEISNEGVLMEEEPAKE